ncbi:hypothetical protein ACQI4F_09235 [Mycolicibacterium vaccae]|uniref:hypothetical protein n=1 Tax=Mycolicibacterium vaccae TaxID=1810 RepID=UPI003CE91723
MEICRVRSPYPRNRAGHAALILGVVALAFVFVPVIGEFVSIPAAVGAVVAGFVGFDRVGRGVATNRRDAVIGGVLGVLVLFMSLLIFAAVHGSGE